MLASLKAIIRNTAVIYAAELANKIFLFVFIVYAARILGVEQFGNFSYSFTLYFLLLMLSDFGFAVYLTREIAQNPAAKDKIFSVALYFRVAITILMLLLFWVYQSISRDTSDAKLFVLITGTSLVISAYASNFVLVLRAVDMMKMDGFIRVAGTFIITLFGLTGIRLGSGMLGIAVALFCGNIMMLAMSLAINRKYRIVALDFSQHAFADLYSMAKKTLPFVTIVILVSIFTRVDTLLLQKLRGSVEVGLYHASSRVMDASLILQASLSMVLLPVLSGLIAAGEMEQVRKIVQLAIKYIAYAGIFITVVMFMTSDKLIEMLYFSPEYRNAVVSLKIFSFVTLVLYVSTPVGCLLLSSPYARSVICVQSLMVALSITLNSILIFYLGHSGAALARLTTETFGLALSVFLINKYIFRLNILENFARPLSAGIVTAVFIYFVKSLLLMPCYLLLYVMTLFALGGISAKEFYFIRDLVAERFRRT